MISELCVKKLLLIVGITCLAACGVSFLFALFNRFGYYHVLDGGADLYARLHQRMNIGFAAAIIFLVIGSVCLFISAKI